MKHWPIWLGLGGLSLFLVGMTRRKRDAVHKITPPTPAPAPVHNREHYPPNSQELTALLADAAPIAGVPASWAGHPELHYIIQHESQGWIGRPNYTYGRENAGRRFGSNISSPSQRARWPQVWAELRAGTKGAKSTATGLGQMILDNARRYYPAGVNGIGVPLDEAVGFLAYVRDRYGSPEEAGRFKRDRGWW